MGIKESNDILERIANALERIASALEDVPKTAGFETQRASSQSTVTFENNSTIEHESEIKSVDRFLESRGIQIKTKKPEDAADEIIDKLSQFLGKNYSALRNILTKIKRSMQTGAPIAESISGYSQKDISSICQFCSRLHDIAFLEQYKYFRSPTYLIRAKTTTLPRAQAFFAGQWLERFTLQKLKSAHKTAQAELGNSAHLDYLINPQVILPNGDDFELDIIALIGGLPIWIEAKSGDYQQHVQKYSKLARIMGLDFRHSIMMLTDVVEDRCESLSSLFSMTVLNLNTIEAFITQTLRDDLQADAKQTTESNL